MAKSKYKAIKIDGVKHDEHRILMETHLGRKLCRDEVVHHVNEDKYDNDISNLEVMSLSEHSRMHQLGRKASPQTLKRMSEAQIGNRYGPPRKLTDDQVRYIREHYIPGDHDFGVRALAKRFGLSHSQVSRAINKKLYTDVE